jgi:SAM-dependent methyltransferase
VTVPSEAHDLRYSFGKNWAEYIRKNFGDEVIERSRGHLAGFLRLDSLKGLTFLDIGCGSGLHSLAAYRMGAERIISFDLDEDSVITTDQVRHYAGDPGNWTLLQGSVLDKEFMEKLPKADIVYSWGVLHHTGDMWTAVRNAAIPMKPDGLLYIALYSSEMYIDPPPQYWIELKRRYNLSGRVRRRIMEWRYVLRFYFLPALKAGRNPFARIFNSRGMTLWTDAKDWLGGYPMDFAGLQQTQTFCERELGLSLVNVKTGEGNTEYLFCRVGSNGQWPTIVKQRKLVPLPGPFTSLGGAGYVSSVPSLESVSDCPEAPRRSELMLYEDDRPLGLAHSVGADIAAHGKGRFSHWSTNLCFSASDNSDPNANGRTYAYCEKF